METPPLKSSSIIVAAAALLAALLPVSLARAADPLMPTVNGVQPFDPNPAAPDSLTRRFMTYGVDSDGNRIPLKTLRITNNTAHTVYPIMRDPNSITIRGSTTIGLYDPYDPAHKEYRGYIGYAEGGKYYFGLKRGESILVSLPLVFWNGARIGIGTDGQYLAPTGDPNPLRYDPNSQRSITKTETGGDTISNGVVMWYRAEVSKAPNDDTEDQLAEWTIRDHVYLVNDKITAKTNREIPDNQLVTLINYDVSNVDNLYLPLAMEANDVWVIPQKSGTGPNANRDGWKAGSVPDVYGWTGAINRNDFLQTRIREFTADNNELLGQYFGKKKQGWPFYNIPNPTNDPNAPRKIPSGANVFAQSPLKAVPSSYGNGQWQNDKYMLSSGGTQPIKVSIGNSITVNPAGSKTLNINEVDPEVREKFAAIEVGDIVIGRPAPNVTNPIQDGTTVTAVPPPSGNPLKYTVTLSKPLVAPSGSCTFEFTRPVHDYASEAMISLWYSWAQYYLAHWKDRTPNAPTTPTRINGSIDKNLATMFFNEAHPELVEGMAVSGPGLDDAMTEKGIHQGNAVILKIASDKKSVTLSQVVNQDSDNKPFTFHPPQPFCTGRDKTGCLLWAPTTEGDPGYPLIGNKFQFSNEPEWHKPYEFSQQVYLIMASMNQIGEPNNDSVSKFMQDIVGANMGFIFSNPAKNIGDAQMVIAMIRDMIKSVLRGVWDFTKFPDTLDDNGNHLKWYPDPKEHRGDQPFNVFNLDPFVWFVHVQLGFSGYGFSVDDDTADVGAGGASELQLSVTGTGGLKNRNAWTIQAPYGPVKNQRLQYFGPASLNGDTLYHAIKNVSNTTPIKITTDGEHHLANGDTVLIDQVIGDNAANGTFKIGNASRKTFELFDAATGTIPVAPSGNYVSGGRWAYPLHPYVDTGADLTKVFYRVTGDDALGTFEGTLLSVDGVDRNKQGRKFRVFQLGRQDVGRLLLDTDLTDANGAPLPAGTYSFDFFGIAEMGTGVGGPPPPKPPGLGEIREDIHEEMDRIRKRLHQLEEQNGESKQSERKSRWLEMRISVLTARLQYPTDEVLQQLERQLEARQSLGRKGLRRFLDRLNTRIVELQNGG
jgi:hypothetical protein